jgi:hypothetical protein
MKSIRISLLSLVTFVILWGCKKEGNYPGAEVSPYISLFDVRNIHTGNDVTLTKQNMFGSGQVTGVVVSDHSGGNLPSGLLVIQDMRRLASLRGISIAIGDKAADYIPGDSVIVNVEGSILKRVDGILQITGLPENAVTKVGKASMIVVNKATIGQMLANPGNFESTLSIIVKGGFNPLPGPTDVLSGDKTLNDGFGDITLHTEPTAAFAKAQVPFSANFYGIVFNTVGQDKQLVPQFRVRKASDIVVLSSAIEVTPVIITGFMSDAKGGDGNYEYVQLMATQDIDFAATPYSMVFTNNANASTPTGFPANGWATGGMRTYKMNLTSGKAARGTFFYIGGTGKMINGSGSTSMSNSNWIKAYDYVNNNGEGFGTKTGGLLANSGNAFGIAVFQGTNITVNTAPIDAVFVATGGSLFTAGPPAMGYRIPNNDFYDKKNPITLVDQPFYRSGTNTLNFVYNTSDLGYFVMLGGEYNPALGRWVKARSQNNILLTKTSAVTEIETTGATILK